MLKLCYASNAHLLNIMLVESTITTCMFASFSGMTDMWQWSLLIWALTVTLSLEPSSDIGSASVDLEPASSNRGRSREGVRPPPPPPSLKFLDLPLANVTSSGQRSLLDVLKPVCLKV